MRALLSLALLCAMAPLRLSGLEAVDADTVVVTGTRTGRLRSDTPVRTELIQKEQIEKTGARTLAEALDYSTGVRVENNCNNCNFQQLRLLGMEGAYSSILTNGLPLQSSLARVYGLEQVPASLIERIEIVKGGGSALYGPNAVAGVVNVITRDPKRTGLELGHTWSTYGAGPNRSSYAVLDYAWDSAPWGLSLFGQGDDVAPFDHNNDGYSEVSRRDFNAFGFRAVGSPWEGGKLSLDMSRGHEERRGGDLMDRGVAEANIAEALRAAQRSGSVVLDQALGGVSNAQISLSQADMERDSYYGAGMDPNAFGNASSRLQALSFNLNLGSADERHIFTVGGQSEKETVEDVTAGYNRFYRVEKFGMGIYAQHDWMPAPWFEFLYGLRHDVDSLIGKAIGSPRAALKLKPSESLSIRGSAASGFRSPLGFDEDAAVSASGGEVQVIFNDPGLIEESTYSYMLGAEWKPESGVTLEANGFLNDVRNLFFNVETDDPGTPDTVEFTRMNFGDAKVWGGELNLGLAVGWATFQAGYVEQRALRNDPDPDFGSHEYFRTPNRYGVLSLDLDGPWAELFIAGRYTGSMKAPHYAGYVAQDALESTPEFWELDLSLSKDFDLTGWTKTGGLKLTLGAKNLLNAYQQDLDQGPLRDAAYVYGPRFPRSYFASAKLNF